ncbi:hypothetical protein TNCV_1674861 [Trichonephila clavipes]|nr:hypothetical protein TNCV_1674861 [Trichonephila clavipes]
MQACGQRCRVLVPLKTHHIKSLMHAKCVETPVETGSSRFPLIVLLDSLGPKKANSFQPNPEVKRDYAN